MLAYQRVYIWSVTINPNLRELWWKSLMTIAVGMKLNPYDLHLSPQEDWGSHGFSFHDNLETKWNDDMMVSDLVVVRS